MTARNAREPKCGEYDLQPGKLFTDEESKKIHSLAVRNVSRNVTELATELSDIAKLTDNHIALWNLIRTRTMNKDICTRTVIQDGMKAMGIDISKNFSHWLARLESHGLISVDYEDMMIISSRKSEEREASDSLLTHRWPGVTNCS
ncbi:hypothetical protein ACQE32_19595 [Pantoea sp. FN0302]|uniref:hypothetical protein n=1 Tax=Pantoea TaxID=53335 RepID=UPI00202B7FB3|nr:hypothetical protein [Pantoea alhagi]URQ60555.1 hypothetical protein LQ939_18120 [Pantoea alhagi]